MKYVDTCTPEERERRALAAMTEMEEAYNFSPDMENDDTDYALMKYLGTKPEAIPDKAIRKSYEDYLKTH